MSDIYLYKNRMWKVKYDFTYTGEAQPFHLNTGEYLCICKGASGGLGPYGANMRNKGGVSYGILNLQNPLDAYAFVGGTGGNYATGTEGGKGGWNGGGNGGLANLPNTYASGAGGGGGTDIRLSIAPDKEIEMYNEIPPQFEQVDYIQSDGTQYINTGATHVANTEIECDCYVSNNPSKNYCAIFGSRNPQLVCFTKFDGWNAFCLPIASQNDTSVPRFSTPLDQNIKITVSGNHWVVYNASDTVVVDYTASVAQTNGSYPMFLFDLNSNGSRDASFCIGRISSFKMKNNGNLVRWMIPFKNTGLGIDVSNIEFESGSINRNEDGLDFDSPTRIRSIGYIPVNPTTYSYFKAIATGLQTLQVVIISYDNDKNYLGTTGWVASGSYQSLSSLTRYVRIVVKIDDSTNITPADLQSFDLRQSSATGNAGLYDLVNNGVYWKGAGNNFTVGNVVSERTRYYYYATISPTLLSRIMVAGGGGGGQGMDNNTYHDTTGFGGGINGGYPVTPNGQPNNHVASSQTSGYKFGIGQNAPNKTNTASTWGAEGCGGGGGGWFGGYAAQITNAAISYSANNGGGGSGYVLDANSYKPERYMEDVSRYAPDLYFSNIFMSAGMAHDSRVIICEPVTTYRAGDRFLCDCLGESTSFRMFPGNYTVKCSGGCGGTRTRSTYAAKGGYAEGTFNNPLLQQVYVRVGGPALYQLGYKTAEWIQTTHPTAGYNGGGKIARYNNTTWSGTGGGGGTDLRIGTDSLYARIIVAGGAGGMGATGNYGGAGGGTSGGNQNGSYGDNYGPGTQTAAGAGARTVISGGFGYGGDSEYRDDNQYGGAGGGGWYGGSGTYPDTGSDDDRSGAGGSGYVLTASSHKPTGYLLGEDYYMTNTQLLSGQASRLYEFPITGMVIECNSLNVAPILCHDSGGYKYYDSTNETWAFLSDELPSVDDFFEYGSNNAVSSEDGLDDEYDVVVYDMLDAFDGISWYIVPNKQTVKFRYHTPLTLSNHTIDADIGSETTMKSVGKREGVAEDAYIYFTLTFDMNDEPVKDPRVYCIHGYTQGATASYQLPNKKEKTLQHIDLLPVGFGNTMPSRYKNYIGSFLPDGTTAITSVQGSICCEHNRCIYSATTCNSTIIRFAKLNLITNTTIILKDIPVSSASSDLGDIKVDDNFIYWTRALTNGTRVIYRTPNGSDTTVNEYIATTDEAHLFQCAGKMEWYDEKTLAVMMRKGIALFDTQTCTYTYKMAASGQQDSARGDWCLGKKWAISLYAGNTTNGWVIDMATNTWESEGNYHVFPGSYYTVCCYNDGKFYIVQRGGLLIIDEETLQIIHTQAVPFQSNDPKQVVYAKGVLYITIQGKPALFIYEISTQTFYSVGMPFAPKNNFDGNNNWISDGWIRMCAFQGYVFVPQIKLYTLNFVDRAKYNVGYKCDQFTAVTNLENEQIADNQYVYDDRFVTFTDDSMWVHPGYIVEPFRILDPENNIKYCSMTKDQYKKLINFECAIIEDDEEESEEP